MRLSQGELVKARATPGEVGGAAAVDAAWPGVSSTGCVPLVGSDVANLM